MTCSTAPARVVRAACGWLALAAALALAGCSGDQRLAITGSVSFKDQPVRAAIVKIYGPGDHLEMAYVRDGTFRITDVTPGEVQVTVEPDPSQGKSAQQIPKKYADRKTSGLVFTITSGTRTLPIKLE
jgi:hypothetical protein